MDKNLLTAVLWATATLIGILCVFYFIPYGKLALMAVTLLSVSGGLTAVYNYELYQESKIKRWQK